MTFVAPGLETSESPDQWSLDFKIDVYERSTIGWQLDIAAKLPGALGEHAGYAALAVLLSYPEKAWQVENGESSVGKSKVAWVAGLAKMLGIDLTAESSEALSSLYSTLRCGLAHNGMTKPGVLLSDQYPSPLEFCNGETRINPWRWAPCFAEHLADYVARLRDVEQSELRSRFETRFDLELGLGA